MFLASGSAAALAFLNPKFLVAALCILAAGSGRQLLRTVGGFAFGAAAVGSATVVAACAAGSSALVSIWLHSLHLAEHYLFDPLLLHDTRLYVSLPARLCFLSGADSSARVLIYGACLLVMLAVLVVAVRAAAADRQTAAHNADRLHDAQPTVRNQELLVASLGPALMVVVSPHLLAYDLCALFLTYCLWWRLFEYDRAGRQLVIAAGALVDYYLGTVAQLVPGALDTTSFVFALTVLHAMAFHRLIRCRRPNFTANRV